MANFSRKTLTLAAGLVLSVMSANAQQMREGYVEAEEHWQRKLPHPYPGLDSWQPDNSRRQLLHLTCKATCSFPQRGYSGAS